MLNLSKCTLTLGKSSCFLRLTWVIQGGALYLLWVSGLAINIKCLLTLILVGQQLKFIYAPYPSPSAFSLEYLSGTWTLIDRDGKSELFTNSSILLDTGFFLILRLSEEAKSKRLLIFEDQLSHEDYWHLRLLEKIN